MTFGDASNGLCAPPSHTEYPMNDINEPELSNYHKFFDATPELETLSSDLAPAKLEPREYQYELYQKALDENVIIVLDTGMGKTLIATMLIKKMVLKERQDRLKWGKHTEQKLVFFVVDRVPLVFQQSSVIRDNCDLKLKELCGEMNVDKMSGRVWNDIFDSNEVCVLTAQILLDCLRRGFLQMERIHLLIFDECHHATKNHPFNLIMKEFYFTCISDQRPKIFGMTASPSSSQKNIERGIMRLEKNLDSRVYTASNLDELDAHMNRPNEILLYYSSPKEYANTLLTRQLKSVLVPYENYKGFYKYIKQTMLHLGPWCSDQMWKFMLLSMERKSSYSFSMMDSMEIDVLKAATNTINSTFQINRNPDISNEALFTPKVEQLISTLKGLVKTMDPFRGIIFVERRLSAIAIHALIESLDCFHTLSTGILLGHGSGADDHVKMNYKQQNRVVESFRRGELSLLIATNVAEEGLDIQPCNVVIRFDFVTTVIAHIQSRGRARKKNSQYVIMLEEHNDEQEKLLQSFLVAEKRMKDFCRMLPSARNVATTFLDDTANDFGKEICIPETGAKLNEHNAAYLVYQYCDSLPSDRYCVLKPVFKISPSTGGYKCTLQLPNNALIRQVESAIFETEDKAKASAVFQACSLLLEKGGLDEHLRPGNYKRKKDLKQNTVQNDENGLAIGSERRQIAYPKAAPGFWSKETASSDYLGIGNSQNFEIPTKDNLFYEYNTEVASYWIGVFEIRLPYNMCGVGDYRNLCLITEKPFPKLPPLKLLYEGATFDVIVRPFKATILLDSKKMKLLSTYMLRVMEGVLEQEFSYQTPYLPYYIAPLVKTIDQSKVLTIDNLETLLDWEEIACTATANNRELSLHDDLFNSIVVDTSESDIFWHVYEVDRSGATNDILLELMEVSKHMNFLNKNEIIRKRPKFGQATWTASCYERFHISLSVYQSMKLIPSIMSRIDSILLVQELQNRFDLCISDTKLLQATTTVSASMDTNYERLEILGDSVLKIVATTCLFLDNPLSDENELSNLREQIISNVSLFRVAGQCELFKYITSQPFYCHQWVPTGFSRATGTEETSRDLNHQTLSDKTLADVVEALLGASFLEYGLEGAVDTALLLGIQLNSVDPSKYFKATQDFLDSYTSTEALTEEFMSIDFERMATFLGVPKFKNPILIAEALTHASYPAPIVSCYQRLEFLGDAVLDIITTNYVYKNYPDADPGFISCFKSKYVNNHTLSIICIETGIYRHIRHCSSQLAIAIQKFKMGVEENMGPPKDLHAPKVLADVIESLLGAVFIEANFQLKPCENIFEVWFLPIVESKGLGLFNH